MKRMTNNWLLWKNFHFIFVRVSETCRMIKSIVLIFSCFAIIIIKLATPFQLSLMDYKACQERNNCSDKNLQPSECPSGMYLDTHMGNDGCCHGCKSGMGEYKKLHKQQKKNCNNFTKKGILISSRSERGESGCSEKKKCAPGLVCDEDFYCILNRSEYCMSTSYYVLYALLTHTFHFQPHVFIQCTLTIL